MKNIIKKLTALALCLSLCICAVSINAPGVQAADTPSGRVLTYSQEVDGSVILNIDGASTSRLIHGVQLQLTFSGDLDPQQIKLDPGESGSYSPAFSTLVSKENGNTIVDLYLVSDYAMNLNGHVHLGELTYGEMPIAPLSAKVSILDSDHMQNGVSPLPVEDLPMQPASGADTWGENHKVEINISSSGGTAESLASARENQIVPVKVTPIEGYKLSYIQLNAGDTPLTKVTDELYTFKMPKGEATITADFTQKGSEEPTPPPTSSPDPAPMPFTDVKEGDWFYDEVKYVYDNQLMDGMAPDKFRPYVDTSRGMLVTILYRLEGEPEVSGVSGYIDVPEGEWYTNAVNWANANGIVNGFPGKIYKPKQAVTRQELAAILYRYAKYKSYDVSARGDLSGFTDKSSVLEYAEEPLQWAVGAGLIKGKGTTTTLAPRGKANRAETAIILQRFSSGLEAR